jgi:hypothetical protein
MGFANEDDLKEMNGKTIRIALTFSVRALEGIKVQC